MPTGIYVKVNGYEKKDYSSIAHLSDFIVKCICIDSLQKRQAYG